MPSTTCSRKERRLHRVFIYLTGPRNIASAGGALYLILFQDNATRMGWLYTLRSKIAAGVVTAMKQFLADVVGDVKCFRTDSGTAFMNETLCGDKTIRHEHTGVDGPTHNGVIERGLGLIEEGGMAACLEPPRLFPGQLPNLDPSWVETTVYMNDCLSTTGTSANPHHKSPYDMFFGKLPSANTLAFMQPGFCRIHRTHKSEPKAEKGFYLNMGRNHPRDRVKVVTLSGQTSDMRSVTWETERTQITSPLSPCTPGAGAHTRPDTRDDDFRVSYVPPVITPVRPVTPLLPPLPPPVMTPMPLVTPVLPSIRVMTSVVTPAPPRMPPPTGMKPPSSPLEIENPQVIGGFPEHQLLQPGRTRSRTRARTTRGRHRLLSWVCQQTTHSTTSPRPTNQSLPCLPSTQVSWASPLPTSRRCHRHTVPTGSAPGRGRSPSWRRLGRLGMPSSNWA